MWKASLSPSAVRGSSCRDPAVPWVFMSYESATNVRQRSSNWGRFPPIDWRRINHVFNRTMGFRRDSDVVVRSALGCTGWASHTLGSLVAGL